MKCIVLAKMSKRIFASIIDFLITLGISVGIFLGLVLPATLDEKVYTSNQNQMNEIKLVSRNYVEIVENNSISHTLKFDIVTSNLTGIEDKNAIPYLNLMDYKETKISVIDSLVRFYVDPPLYQGKNVFGVQETTAELVAVNLLKVGKEVSNIKELSLNEETNTYQISLIDESKQSITIEFISQLIKPDSLDYTTCIEDIVLNCSAYKALMDQNNNMMLFSLIMILPVLFGTSFIFYFLVPIFSKNGETIGKYILGLGVLSADGYVLKKYYYIPRYFSFFILEFAGGILTFGGFFLVTYILFCFNKKRRSVHDFLSNSVVIDKKASVWFVDRDQEYRYNYKTRIN